MKRIAFVLALAGTAAACASADNGEPPLTPTERYQLRAVDTTESVNLAVRDDGLSPGQRRALAHLASVSDAGEVTVAAGSDARSQAHAAAVRRFLADLGVSAARMSPAAGADPAVVTVSVKGLGMEIPDCNREWTQLADNRNNQGYANFGCSVTANMAVQIADPADVIAPAGSTPPDAARRAVVMDKYRRGEPTAAAVSDRNKSDVAQTVK